jgi:hypothetical protein
MANGICLNHARDMFVLVTRFLIDDEDLSFKEFAFIMRLINYAEVVAITKDNIQEITRMEVEDINDCITRCIELEFIRFENGCYIVHEGIYGNQSGHTVQEG